MRNNTLINHFLSIILLPGTVTLVIPYYLNEYLSEPNIYEEHIILKIAGILCICIGLLLLFSTIILFSVVGKGTLAPWFPTRKLVVKGPYKYVRNPMICGVLSILFGEALFLNSISILIWAMLFFLINHLYFEFVEEAKLERKFGDPYVTYKNKVPRWIPNLRPYRQS